MGVPGAPAVLLLVGYVMIPPSPRCFKAVQQLCMSCVVFIGGFGCNRMWCLGSGTPVKLPWMPLAVTGATLTQSGLA